MSRTVNTVLGAVLVLALSFSIFTLVLRPDPGTGYFAKAQNFESKGEIGLAIQHYLLIADSQPHSFYAPRALMRAADLKAAAAGQTNDEKGFRAAMGLYQRVAENYPSDPLAVEAMLSAGQIAAEHLHDRAAAKGIYETILDRFGKTNTDLAATATLKLGRLAVDGGDGKSAVPLLQKVLQRWPNLQAQASEAQYYLGVAYETLLKNREWATHAYEAVIARYPQSTWAGEARQRLGLIVFSDTRGQRPARRVLIDVQPLPDAGNANGSLWDTLRLVFAARGVEADGVDLRGWSLSPFYAGIDPANPGKLVSPPYDAFETVIGNAGMRFTVKSGGNEREALRDLQDEIDAARPPLVYLADPKQKHWTMVVGYDSDRGEVMLQDRGARFDTLAARTFAGQWKVSSELGQEFTLLSFTTPGKSVPKPSLTPTPLPSPAPGQTPLPQLLAPPSFVWELPRLDEKSIHRRSVRRAAGLLARPREGNVLLNQEALNMLAVSLQQASERPAPLPQPTATTADTVPVPEGEPTESPYEPTPTPRAGGDTAAKDLQLAKRLLPFFGAPAQEWANRRRDAAAYLEAAARSLHDSRLNRAADTLRDSAEALTQAAEQAPNSSELDDGLTDTDRSDLAATAQSVRRAYEAERRAADLMRQE